MCEIINIRGLQKMADKFKKFVEKWTGTTYVPRDRRCDICDGKLGVLETGFWSVNAYRLSNGILCRKCGEKVKQLITEKNQWMTSEMLNEKPWKSYNYYTWNSMSVQTAMDLIALKKEME